MNKMLFRVLVLFMSLALIGIILIQFYWFNVSVNNNKEQFKLQIKQVLANVAEKLDEKEAFDFQKLLAEHKKDINEIDKTELFEFGYYQRNKNTNETIIYTNSILSRDFVLPPKFFESQQDSMQYSSISSQRNIEVYKDYFADNSSIGSKKSPDVQISKTSDMDLLDKLNFKIALKDVMSTFPISERIDLDFLNKLIKNELDIYGINMPYEFGVYSKGLATKVKSENFRYDKELAYGVPIFTDNEGVTPFNLYLLFPNKNKFLISEIYPITLLSLFFTLIIVFAYIKTLSQLLKQRQISEIKTDFINNMTHEFKTPIATINLALDAIKNPKVMGDEEKVKRYLNMIKDENRRMNAQVENVLRISKLEKNELDIKKSPLDIVELLENAIDHVSLILDDRQGVVNKKFNATNTTALINETHIINVFVNVLENAIKYSEDAPEITVETKDLENYIEVSIADNGVGMSKQALKRIFEKFYREPTGNIHNVKGHGLGLSYVKKIVDMHQGEILVESEKNIGSTFRIKIPIIN